MRDPLEPLAVRPFAGDHDARRGVIGDRVQQQVDPLRAVEPVDREDEVAVLVAAEVEILRRRQDDLGVEPEVPLQPLGHIAGDRVAGPRLAERRPVEPVDRAPRRPVDRVGAELPELGSVQLVRLPELVHEPDDLVRMADDVGGELRPDYEVDRPAVHLVEVDHPPEERLGEDALAGIPLEGHGHESRLVAPRMQLLRQPLGEHLGAAVRERHLGTAHGDPHQRRATTA